MHSKIYVGQVSHCRHLPHRHQFDYPMFMLLLDLDELDTVFENYWLWSSKRFNLAWFNRKHHLGDSNMPLKESVRQLVADKTGFTLNGPVRLLTHLSYFGYGFNPVSFYYCYDHNDKDLVAIVAEVNNTPWGEQHCYVFTQEQNTGNANTQRYCNSKQFHVSPFNPMNQDYRWIISAPAETLKLSIENWQDNQRIFDASLNFSRQEISSRTLASALLRFPAITLKVSFSIYYQALKLLLKRTPIYDHPGSLDTSVKQE